MSQGYKSAKGTRGLEVEFREMRVCIELELWVPWHKLLHEMYLIVFQSPILVL